MKTERVGGVAQVVECLSSKALSSKFSTIKNFKKSAQLDLANTFILK
jgi:hypothetical protein